MASRDHSPRTDYRPVPPISLSEETRARALVSRHLADPHIAREVLEILGLADDLPPLPPLAEERTVPVPVLAPTSREVVASRAAADRRRRAAALDFLRSQGLRGRALDDALARMEA
ncbi:hypothetical protein ACF07Q_28730 [Nocardiopsis dassonvillei]|uniref:hypothetical protein n=1 Tax=Nocardiopsis dassonvillei TaxID=2014 RepID=UPI003702859F